MCFIIQKSKQVPWNNRTVYKVVRWKRKSLPGWEYHHGVLISTLHFYEWSTGEHEIGKHSTTSYRRVYDNALVAHKGFYVYRTEEIAQRQINSTVYEVILRLKVDPKDFLFHSGHNEIATYRRVVVPIQQPGYEFID